jgi:arginine repressor
MKLDRLQERINFHRERIRAYELVLEDLNGHLTERATGQLPAKLQKAIQLRQAVNGKVGVRQTDQQERQAILRDFIKPDQAYKITHLVKALKARGYVPSLKTLHMDLDAIGMVAGAGRLWRLQSTADGTRTGDVRVPAQQERRAILRDFIQPRQTYKANQLKQVLKDHGHVVGASAFAKDMHSVGMTTGGEGSKLWQMPSTAKSAAAAPRQIMKKKQPKTKAAINQQRKKTAKLIAKLDTLDAPFPSTAFGPHGSILIRHGYVKKQGDGYARTEKQFTV